MRRLRTEFLCDAPPTRRFPRQSGREVVEQHEQAEGGTMVGAIVLGVVAGYIGRLLMPGRDKMGFIMTVLLGLAGSVVGFLVFTELLGVGDDKMFDLGGLIGAIIGVMILLGLYRVALKNKEHPLAR
jgi:uncharacterized membrane protein YeaQ/YmgE (transglycosylase-associated protein family)